VASKRDQLQAHRFLTRRVMSALVVRQPDPEQPPFRRASAAAIGSIVLAALVLTGMFVYGLVVPGGNRSWQAGDAVIVVKETGARYVYVDGRLHPALNYTSALLAIGRPAKTRTVSRESLIGVPRGARIGIPDAPDALPATGRLLRGGWSFCSRPGADETGARVDESVLLAGVEPAGGRPLGEAALLVTVPELGDQYLIWHGYRHRIARADAVAVGVALRPDDQVRADPAVVDVLPAGDPLAPIALPGAGGRSTAVPRRDDLRIGQLAITQTTGGDVQHYLVEADRLRSLSELQYDIQLAYPGTATAYSGDDPVGVPLPLTAAAQAEQSGARPSSGPGAAPERRPAFAAAATLCVTYDSAATPVVRLDAGLPALAETVPTEGRTPQGLPLADQVYVPPGRAALVEAMPSEPSPTGTLMLVTDQARAYPLAGPEVLGILGYDKATPLRLPAGLVTRVPLGSGLDPTAARAS
jgi:type VII secretion protein EccB